MEKRDKDVHIRIPAKTLARIRFFARSSYRNTSDVINLAIHTFLKTVEKDEQST